jgi:hypothetical protein
MLKQRTEGIFRVPANSNDVEECKDKIDDGEKIDLSLLDSHTVGGLLKLYLKELPEPLFTFNKFDEFLQASRGKYFTLIFQ